MSSILGKRSSKKAKTNDKCKNLFHFAMFYVFVLRRCRKPAKRIEFFPVQYYIPKQMPPCKKQAKKALMPMLFKVNDDNWNVKINKAETELCARRASFAAPIPLCV